MRLEHFIYTNASTILNIYSRAHDIVEDELQELDHRASVASPLIEFFILNSSKDGASAQDNGARTDGQTRQYDFSITSSYDFLTNVIWTHGDRAEEINRLVHAALGPMGAVLGGKLQAERNGTAKISAQDSGGSTSPGGGASQGSGS
jgi:hypothetical protein